ncbi:hypothetical protein Q7P37_001429 [Cladosporium fusiforme]
MGKAVKLLPACYHSSLLLVLPSPPPPPAVPKKNCHRHHTPSQPASGVFAHSEQASSSASTHRASSHVLLPRPREGMGVSGRVESHGHATPHARRDLLDSRRVSTNAVQGVDDWSCRVLAHTLTPCAPAADEPPKIAHPATAAAAALPRTMNRSRSTGRGIGGRPAVRLRTTTVSPLSCARPSCGSGPNRRLGACEACSRRDGLGRQPSEHLWQLTLNPFLTTNAPCRPASLAQGTVARGFWKGVTR